MEVDANRHSVLALLQRTDLGKEATTWYGEVLIVEVDNIPSVLDKRHSMHQGTESLANGLSLRSRKTFGDAFVISEVPDVCYRLVDDKGLAYLVLVEQEGRRLLKGDSVIVRIRRLWPAIDARPNWKKTRRDEKRSPDRATAQDAAHQTNL